MPHIPMRILLHVKARNAQHAQDLIANRLNKWFNDPTQQVSEPMTGFPFGSLLSWRFGYDESRPAEETIDGGTDGSVVRQDDHPAEGSADGSAGETSGS
jgi:hypothetical protein